MHIVHDGCLSESSSEQAEFVDASVQADSHGDRGAKAAVPKGARKQKGLVQKEGQTATKK